jgi:hypothetical protein
MTADRHRPPLTPGRLVYLLWHAPRGWLERCRRAGGFGEAWRTHRARAAMRRAAAHLKPLPVAPPDADAPALAFLTGRGFWEQTAFCLRSLQRQTPGERWPVLVVDDGTLAADTAGILAGAFPGLTLHRSPEIGAALDRNLPEAAFPTLRRHRVIYPHLRKLTDVHAARPGWNLVLDSDMLFHRRPDELIAWFRAPDRPLVLTDIADAYGYAPETLARVTGRPPPPRINVGATGLSTASVPWKRIEDWVERLLREHGSSYYLEQALVAALVAEGPFLQLPAGRYRVHPDPRETASPSAALHHYVADGKHAYVRHAWRSFA